MGVFESPAPRRDPEKICVAQQVKVRVLFVWINRTP